MRLVDQCLVVHRPERLLERAVEHLEHFLPRQIAILDLVEFLLHGGREIHIELIRELLDHHLLHALAERRGEETALLEFRVVPFC